VKKTDPEYQAERLAHEFYAESWALVHLLLFDDKTLQGPTSRYLRAIDEGYPEEDAFKAFFPFDKNELDKQLRALLSHRVIHLIAMNFPHGVAIDTARISRLTEAQADAQIARLALLLNRPKEIVMPLAAAALSESPADPSMRALYARIAVKFDEPASLADLVASVTAGGDFDPQLRTDLATAVFGHESTDISAQQAFAIIDPVMREPAPPIEAVELWAHAALRTGVEPSRVLAVLDLASSRDAHNMSLLHYIANAYEALGDKPKARDTYNQIILLSPNLAERLWAQRQADSPRLRDPQ
jgi:hypothetical protein